jgi:hypothetical protein
MYVFTGGSNEQYPCLKDSGSGSCSGHMRGGMFIVPSSVPFKSGEWAEIIDQVSTK